MIHVIYHHLHDGTGRVIGYRVEAYDPNSGKVYDTYTAGNSPVDSTWFETGPRALPRAALLKHARSTAREMYLEVKQEHPTEKVLCFWDVDANRDDRELQRDTTYTEPLASYEG